MKTKGMNDEQFLALLQKVLPKTITDSKLVSTIYEEVAKEVRLVNSLASFEKFCERGSIPNLEPTTVSTLQESLGEKFGETNVALIPDEETSSVMVEISLPDRTVNARITVNPDAELEGDEAKVPFVPFPVALPSDEGLVWMLARREDFGPDEAARALVMIEEEFWATKKGIQLQKERVEKNFAEFITHVPAAALKESGLRRHYKEPSALKTLRLLEIAEE